MRPTVPSLFPERISNSMLSSLYTCETKWFKTYCLRLGSFEASPDLIAGRIFASACEKTRLGFYVEGLTEADAIELGVELILTAEDVGHKNKSNEWVADRFKNYFKVFKLTSDYSPATLANGSRAVEYKFDIELPILNPDTGKPLIYTGKIDAIMEKFHPGTKQVLGYYIHDEKTTEKLTRIPFSASPENPKGLVDEEKEYKLKVRNKSLDLKGFLDL